MELANLFMQTYKGVTGKIEWCHAKGLIIKKCDGCDGKINIISKSLFFEAFLNGSHL